MLEECKKCGGEGGEINYTLPNELKINKEKL